MTVSHAWLAQKSGASVFVRQKQSAQHPHKKKNSNAAE